MSLTLWQKASVFVLGKFFQGASIIDKSGVCIKFAIKNCQWFPPALSSMATTFVHFCFNPLFNNLDIKPLYLRINILYFDVINLYWTGLKHVSFIKTQLCEVRIRKELSTKASKAIISSNIFPPKLEFTGNPFLRGRLSTLDLLVLTSFDQLLLMMQVLLTFLQFFWP